MTDNNPTFLLVDVNHLANKIQRAGLKRDVTGDMMLSEISDEVAMFRRACKLTYRALDILDDLITARKMSFELTSRNNDEIAKQLASIQYTENQP